MRKLAVGVTVAVAAFALCSSNAFAKKSRKAAPPEIGQPCPIDEPIRVGSGQAISRYSSLSSCAGKIIIAPATDADLRETIRIVPQYQESETSVDDSSIGMFNRPVINTAEHMILANPAA